MANQSNFPGFVPLQFAQSPDMGAALAGLGKSVGSAGKAMMAPPAPPAVQPAGVAVPGAQGPSSVGGSQGPMPLQQAPPPTLMDALKNMSPAQVLASLQRTSLPPTPPPAPPGMPPGMPPGAGMPQPGMQPGSAIFDQAGMTPVTFGG
jgi:hypothetical protein